MPRRQCPASISHPCSAVRIRAHSHASMRITTVGARLHHPSIALSFERIVNHHGLRRAGILRREVHGGIHLVFAKRHRNHRNIHGRHDQALSSRQVVQDALFYGIFALNISMVAQ